MSTMPAAGLPEIAPEAAPDKFKLFGIGISITDYDQASDWIINQASTRKSAAMSALAVHGLMESVNDPKLGQLVNGIDLVTPDGKPVMWAMNALGKTQLKFQVTGPDLTLKVCEKAASTGVSVFLFGSTAETLEKCQNFLVSNYPGIKIAGTQADRFREANIAEDAADIATINASGAGIILVGRGCPRQERWVAQHQGKINGVMMAVGAAFDFMAGNLSRSPQWVNNCGLEWLYRLYQEPQRLFKRYATTNIQFIFLFIKTWLTRN